MSHVPTHISLEAVSARRKRTRRRIAMGVVVTVAATAWSVGYASTGDAAWLMTGSGNSASVAAGTAGSLSISAATPATGLVPNGSKDVTFTVHNPNAFPVKINGASVASLALSGGTDSTVCNSATVAGLNATMDGTAIGTTIPANGDSASLKVTIAMSAAADNACQGVSVTPSVSITAAAVAS